MQEKQDFIPLSQLPEYTIMRTAMRMITILYRIFHNQGYQVTPQQWSVLHSLWEEEGLSPSQLAQKTGRDRQTITRILNVLEKNELIQRTDNTWDKRRSNIFLTKQGKTLKNKLAPMARDFSQHVFAGFSQEEIFKLQALHERIFDNIQNFKI